MNEVRRVLKVAAFRLLVIDLFHTLAVMVSGAILALIAVLLAQRIFGLAIAFPGDWVRIAAIAFGAAVVGAVVWSMIRRARGIELAREVDERADLRESLSTAMCVSRSEDAWAKVVVENARQKAVGVDVKRAIPYVAPRVWPVPLALALSLVVLWFSVPQWDVLGALKSRTAQKQEETRIAEVKAQVKEVDQKIQELLKQAKVELKDDEAGVEANEQSAPQTPDEIRRAAVKKLTNQVDRLGEMQQGDKAKQLEAIKQAMKQLKQPGPGPMEQMSKSLQQGDFAKAQEQLDELAKQMGENSMSPEDKAKLQEQMQKLSEQMQKLAQEKQNLEKQLQQAGMSKEQAQKAASNPEDLKKALDEMKDMSEGQKQELMKNALAQMGACKQCEGMGEKLGQMAKNMGKEGMSQEGQQAMESLAGQLSEMEQLDQEMESLDAAMNEAMKQLAKMGGECEGSCNGEGEGECEGGELAGLSQKQSPWRAGESNKQGSGQGGPGQAWGRRAASDVDAPVQIDKVKSPTKKGEGPIIGSRLVYGDQVRGESVAEFSAVIESSAKAASEDVVTMQVPKELEKTVKSYFGRLEAKAKAKKAGETGEQASEKK